MILMSMIPMAVFYASSKECLTKDPCVIARHVTGSTVVLQAVTQQCLWHVYIMQLVSLIGAVRQIQPLAFIATAKQPLTLIVLQVSMKCFRALQACPEVEYYVIELQYTALPHQTCKL